ncbi:MAG: hypothetical protein DCC68_17695 [Planctomycetota bacterium]|nr:MAG: hypothetical protein DCC68_17695 [Planctomycetota bacterium]
MTAIDLGRELSTGPLANHIRRKATQLAYRREFGDMGRDDIEQEIRLYILAKADKYDPASGCWEAFARGLVKRFVATLVRRQSAAKGGRLIPHASLNADVQTDEGPIEAARLVGQWHRDAVRGLERLSLEEQRLLAADVDAVIASLTPEDRDLCERLKAQSLTDAARDLGISRTTLRRRLTDLRERFAAAGLELEPAHHQPGSISQEEGNPPMPACSTPTGNDAAPAAEDFLIHEPAEAYHAKSGHYLSSHLLADFRKCPLLYHRKVSGLVAENQERPAYLIGRAAHALILEGQQAFDDQFVVGGPINPKTGFPFGPNTKAFGDWQRAHGKTILTDEQHLTVVRMADAVREHARAADLLREGEAEGVVRAEHCHHPCQIRMDWFDAHQGIVDLKTCDDLTWFEADARRYGYAHQLAFYRAVLAQVIGLWMPVHLIAVEKREPYRCGVWRVEPQTLAIAQQENEAAIGRLQRCQLAGHWPTGYEEPRLFDAA